MQRLIYIVCFFLLANMSCDDGFEELNQNPLEPSNVSSGALFNSIIQSLQLGWNRQLFIQNEVLYDVTEQAVVTAKTFGNIDGGSEEIWTNYYSALKNANELKRRFNASQDDAEVNDIMRSQLNILMAYKTFQLTDFFGDIPYSEAGQAFADQSIIRAKYDSQEEIYKSLIDELLEASSLLAEGGQTASGNSYLRYGSFDTFFGDNTDRWIRFANSLALRHLVRMYDVDSDFAAPRISDLISSGANTITKGNDVIMSPVVQEWRNLGVNWSFREHNKVRMGSTMWNWMTDDQGEIVDPRVRIFFETNVDDEWVAFPQVSNDDTPQSGGEPYQKDRRDADYADKGAGNIYSPVNFYLIRDELDIPEILMTSAEVKFLRAEIFLRGLGVVEDQSLASQEFQLGMIESLEFWQNIVLGSDVWINRPPTQSISDLFSVVQNVKYAFEFGASVEDNLNKIYAQRWIDSFRQPWEAFSLLRRTNSLPREKEENDFYRFTYPPSEAAFNTEQYNNQVAKMGADQSNVKLWWME